MRVTGTRLVNVGSFLDSGWIAFGPTFNVLVGENNTGKSTILKSLDRSLSSNPHRNDTVFETGRIGPQLQELDIEFSGAEFEATALNNSADVYWPIKDKSDYEDEFRAFLSSRSETLKLRRVPGGAFQSRVTPSHQRFSGEINRTMQFQPNSGDLRRVGFAAVQDGLPSIATMMWESSRFYFDAQRFSVGRSAFGIPDRLDSNAANLPAVLFRLQGERGTLFQRLVAHLREMFSTVRNLSVGPDTANGGLEIRVWPIDEQLRPELSSGLDSCGTGISQAVAILTVAMTFDNATIIIDEISSFLHPAAAKSLLRILQTEYSRHQFIISTHSPDVLASCTPSKVYLVRKIGFESKLEQVDLDHLENLRMVATQIGVSMSDVFAAEHIIWVEGPTEELCFPYIHAAFHEALPKGVLFTPVVATGDFAIKGPRKDLVLEIYQRLSQSAAPLVRSVMFGFDSEVLTASERKDLTKQAGGRLLFLPARNLECFLLDSEAIARFLVDRVPDLASSISPNSVSKWIEEHGGDSKYGAKDLWHGSVDDAAWWTQVDGAMILRDLCSTLTEQRLTFRKKVDTLDILKLSVERDRARLRPLAEYVQLLVNTSMSSPA